jgi:large subunit ribosomal protein L19
MSNDLLRNNSVVSAQMRTDFPDFKTGSIIEVDYKIVEGGKERIQTFRGLVINRHAGTSMDATFTVLKDSTFRIKVERTFPLHSPFIVAIRVVANQQARRANIRNMAKLKDPIKSVRTRPFIPRVNKVEVIESVQENTAEIANKNVSEARSQVENQDNN